MPSFFSAPRTDIIQVQNVKLRFGAKGDGVTDDTAAINAALATGGVVYLPRGIYNFSAALNFSNTIGQRMIGDGPNLTTLTTLTAGLDAMNFHGRSQQLENLTLSGPGASTAGNGVSIPEYSPYWALYNVLIRDFNDAVYNKTLHGGEIINGQAYPYGSDAGGIFGSQITNSHRGLYTFGNQDSISVFATSVGSCDVAGVEVDGGGGVAVGGGRVMGGNGTHLRVTSGKASLKDVHTEGDSSSPGFSGFSVDVAANSFVSIQDCMNQTNDDPAVISVRVAAGAIAELSGINTGFGKGRVNGTGQIHLIGGRPGDMLVDYNGGGPDYAYYAGNYDAIAPTLPVATATDMGRRLMLIVPGVSRQVYTGAQTGASTYAWVREIPTDGRINLQGIPISSSGLVSGDIWSNSGILTIV